MQREAVLKELQNVFDDIFIDDVTVTTELTAGDVNEWDSILHVSLILAVEKAFNIRFRVGEVEATRNVGDLADVIVKRTSTS